MNQRSASWSFPGAFLLWVSLRVARRLPQTDVVIFQILSEIFDSIVLPGYWNFSSQVFSTISEKIFPTVLLSRIFDFLIFFLENQDFQFCPTTMYRIVVGQN